jgi:hypothetical protein
MKTPYPFANPFMQLNKKAIATNIIGYALSLPDWRKG